MLQSIDLRHRLQPYSQPFLLASNFVLSYSSDTTLLNVLISSRKLLFVKMCHRFEFEIKCYHQCLKILDLFTCLL